MPNLQRAPGELRKRTSLACAACEAKQFLAELAVGSGAEKKTHSQMQIPQCCKPATKQTCKSPTGKKLWDLHPLPGGPGQEVTGEPASGPGSGQSGASAEPWQSGEGLQKVEAAKSQGSLCGLLTVPTEGQWLPPRRGRCHRARRAVPRVSAEAANKEISWFQQ